MPQKTEGGLQPTHQPKSEPASYQRSHNAIHYALSEVAKMNRIILDKFNETRTIRIKGKNVDVINLEKIASLIQQANEKTSKTELKGLYKILKRALP